MTTEVDGTRSGLNGSAPAGERLSLVEVAGRLRDRDISSVELVTMYRERISRHDSTYNAIAALHPLALREARAADRRRNAGASRSALDGVPVMFKDNIETKGLATYAGSRSLLNARPSRDALLVSLTKSRGMVTLGKTNLSEWGNFRSFHGIEGWSGTGGQVRNAIDPTATPGGSSSGSAVAVATGMTALAFGTETDGSIVDPAGLNGVVGVKPAVGTLPMTGIVQTTPAQDVAGTFTRNVADAVLAWQVIAGRTQSRGQTRKLRVGVWRASYPAEVQATLSRVEAACRASGHTLVEVKLSLPAAFMDELRFALAVEYRDALTTYLRGREGGPATIDELIAFNEADAFELRLFGQELLELIARVDTSVRDARRARAHARRWARRSLLRAMTDAELDAIVAPTNEPAHPLAEPRPADAFSSSTLPAVAGWANVSIPTGTADTLPIGLSVFGHRSADDLLSVAWILEATLAEAVPTHQMQMA